MIDVGSSGTVTDVFSMYSTYMQFSRAVEHKLSSWSCILNFQHTHSPKKLSFRYPEKKPLTIAKAQKTPGKAILFPLASSSSFSDDTSQSMKGEKRERKEEGRKKDADSS